MANDKNNKYTQLGALWKKVSTKTKKKYLQGYIMVDGERVNVVAFVNQAEDKTSEKSPDIVIIEQQPLDDNGGGKKSFQKKSFNKPNKFKKREQEEDDGDGEDNGGDDEEDDVI